MKFEPASLETIGNGKAIEKVNFELENAFNDIRDENKDPEKPREVILKIKLKADAERKHIAIEYQASTKMVPDRAGVDLAHMEAEDVVVSTSEQLDLDMPMGEIPSIGNTERSN